LRKIALSAAAPLAHQKHKKDTLKRANARCACAWATLRIAPRARENASVDIKINNAPFRGAGAPRASFPSTRAHVAWRNKMASGGLGGKTKESVVIEWRPARLLYVKSIAEGRRRKPSVSPVAKPIQQKASGEEEGVMAEMAHECENQLKAGSGRALWRRSHLKILSYQSADKAMWRRNG
jgi:hypothetical protein